MKRPSLTTIAKEAKVSVPVVYTALNNREGKGIFVSKKTREEILEIAKKVGYVPNKSAKQLLSGRSNTIGVIFQKLVPPFNEIVACLHKEAHKQGLDLIPYITDGNPEMEEYYLNLIRDGRVDGAIAIATRKGSKERYEKFTNPPYNLKILHYGPLPLFPNLHFDEEEAGRLAAKHLIEVGCKNFAFFGGDENLIQSGGEKNFLRAKGFVNYLLQKGCRKPVIFSGSGFAQFFNDGKILAQEFLRLKNIPDGIFASNDLLAIALFYELEAHGLKVPEDVAIIGCDNTEICLYTYPNLTSIDINIPVTAQKLISVLKDMIDGKKPIRRQTTVPVSIVVRESTKRQGGGK